MYGIVSHVDVYLHNALISMLRTRAFCVTTRITITVTDDLR